MNYNMQDFHPCTMYHQCFSCGKIYKKITYEKEVCNYFMQPEYKLHQFQITKTSYCPCFRQQTNNYVQHAGNPPPFPMYILNLSTNTWVGNTGYIRKVMNKTKESLTITQTNVSVNKPINLIHIIIRKVHDKMFPILMHTGGAHHYSAFQTWVKSKTCYTKNSEFQIT